ncbi:MAG: NAD(P)H-dependent oxidoreductase [Blastochloris sp.]|nr:NAD(P)H-dependent oxidoreductase [Blastochloris sp.]
MSAFAPVQVLGICGSLRAESYTRQALAMALAAAQHRGAEVVTLHNAELTLPLCNGTDPKTVPDVVHLRTRVQSADALLIGSPEYCGTLSSRP